jgi:hypothetical protein
MTAIVFFCIYPYVLCIIYYDTTIKRQVEAKVKTTAGYLDLNLPFLRLAL